MDKRNENKSITIDDVAKLAGVSRATAGRVVGNYGSVSESAKTKVKKAIEELGYYPNAIAQGLRSNTSKTIAVVVESINNHLFSELTSWIEKVALKKGYSVMVCSTHENPLLEIQHLSSLHNRRVEGIVIAATSTSETSINKKNKHLYDGDIPMVYVDREVKGTSRNLIVSNNRDAGYKAAQYLIELGHQKIGGIATTSFATVAERFAGYQKAMEDEGIGFHSDNFMKIDYEAENVEEILEKGILSRIRELTAIIVFNNSLLAPLLLGLRKKGLSIPEDISIVAWDDENLNQLMEITTMKQQVEKLGTYAAERLFELIEMPDRRGDTYIQVLETEMIVRKSCREIKEEG
ncbi:LacI family DNA-binding transcriptional regulator [Lactonifactor longoviformis]|uniref:Transcriptional regulator, LacI family n=2 Tax=Lactonifactor TaxID=420345 RepID=A0A1M5A3R1_9CLOT|nr:LacI family DNA-binding transcriptional regulator [Lactonifactor longoviformis]SHF24864.1 transcriptional regulator, LacI family [Lactonifactor longoviformis DSM 17459]